MSVSKQMSYARTDEFPLESYFKLTLIEVSEKVQCAAMCESSAVHNISCNCVFSFTAWNLILSQNCQHFPVPQQSCN